MKRIAASAALVAWGCNEPVFHPVAAPDVPVVEDPWDVCDAGDAVGCVRVIYLQLEVSETAPPHKPHAREM